MAPEPPTIWAIKRGATAAAALQETRTHRGPGAIRTPAMTACPLAATAVPAAERASAGPGAAVAAANTVAASAALATPPIRTRYQAAVPAVAGMVAAPGDAARHATA